MKIEIKFILEYKDENYTEQEKKDLYEKISKYMRKERSTDEFPPLDDKFYTDLVIDKQIDFPDKWEYDVTRIV